MWSDGLVRIRLWSHLEHSCASSLRLWSRRMIVMIVDSLPTSPFSVTPRGGGGDLFPSLCHSGSHVSSSRGSIASLLNLTACGEREGKQGNCKNIFQNQNRKSGGHGMATDAVGAGSRSRVAPDCGGLGNSFHCRSGMKRERTGECTAVTD